MLGLRWQEAPGVSDTNFLIVNFQNVTTSAAHKAEKVKSTQLGAFGHNGEMKDSLTGETQSAFCFSVDLFSARTELVLKNAVCLTQSLSSTTGLQVSDFPQYTPNFETYDQQMESHLSILFS